MTSSDSTFRADDYLLPAIEKWLAKRMTIDARIIDAGCGDGYAGGRLASLGYSVTGFDWSEKDIAAARQRYPRVAWHVMSVYDAKVQSLAQPPADVVLALEVVEHLFSPRKLFEQARRLLRPGGYLIASTPYHGYWKNLAISLLGKWDQHFDVTWEGGHIKFFSPRTLSAMARDVSFSIDSMRRVGRVPGFEKSMILVARREG